MKSLNLASSLLALVLLAGCSSSGKQFQSFAKSFPSQQEITELQKDEAKPVFRDASEDGRVPYWTLTGPLPNSWGSQTIRPTTPVGKGIDAAFSSARMTESMACVARESGIFYAHYERYPYVELRDFIAQRCGSVAGGGSAIWLLKMGDATASEAQVAKGESFREWAEGLADKNDKDGKEYGVWFGSGRNGTYVVVTVDTPGLEVNPVPLKLTGRDEVVIEGKVAVEADAIFAVVTKGEYDTSDCVTSTGVEMPAFRITCPIDPNDPDVTLSISRGREGDVFTRGVASPRFWLAKNPSQMFVAAGSRGPSPSSSNATTAEVAPATTESSTDPYEESAADTPNTSGNKNRPTLIQKSLKANDVSPAALRARFIERVNDLRKRAGRAPLELSPEQSDANALLLPYMFGNDDDQDVKNNAVLGALAGWKVKGKIINGTVQFQSFSNADVDDIVVSMAASASGRRAILREELDASAIGSVFDEETQSVAVVVTSYEFVDQTPHLERVNTFLDKLAKARASRGASPPRKVGVLKPVADRLDKRVRAGTMTFNEAANELLNESFDQYQRDTFIYAGAAHDPMRLTFEERILEMEPLRISIMVTPFKPEGSPWYAYGIVIVYPKTKQVTKVALAGSDARAHTGQ